jgi:branched-chain amino acid transport system ATP-binding protein
MAMLLEIANLTKRFGGLQVLNDVSFTVHAGEILGLIGPTGAGKSTLFNLITGVYLPNEGEIQFREKSLVGLKPHRICKRGIARTFQLVRIFPAIFRTEILAKIGG